MTRQEVGDYALNVATTLEAIAKQETVSDDDMRYGLVEALKALELLDLYLSNPMLGRRLDA